MKLGFVAVLVMTALQANPVKKAWVLANSLAAARIDKGKKKQHKQTKLIWVKGWMISLCCPQ